MFAIQPALDNDRIGTRVKSEEDIISKVKQLEDKVIQHEVEIANQDMMIQ